MSLSDWINSNILSIVSLALYIVTFAPGMGPVPWTINSEIYPLRLRSKGNSFATAVNWASNIVVSQSFPILMGGIGTGSTFLILAGVCVIAILFCYIAVPETKGLSLEEVAQ